MADPAPLARSPIAAPSPTGTAAGWEISLRRSSEALTLADWTPMAKVLVHAPPDGPLSRVLGVPFGTARRTGGGALVARVQPAQWLICAPPSGAPGLVEEWTAAAGDEFATVVDVTSGRALLRLTGDEAPAVLAKLCALDLGAAPGGSAYRSPVAHTPVEIIRDDIDGRPSFLLACDRSLGQYLFDGLLDAGAEFAIDVTRFDPEDGDVEIG